MFLFSLTINAQEVGQEYLANPGINTATGANSTTPETGVDGGGNFPANLGGWGAGTGGAFASASDANGACHSADRMFKFFKVGGADGQYVNQTITDLPAGNYNWSFYTKWGDAGHASGPTGTAAGNLPSWSAEGDNEPKFTILVQDADGAWVADQATVTSEPATVLTWIQDSGTWTNTETRDVRIKFAKNGGTAAAGGSNTDKLMFIDDASLTYASALETSSGCDLSINMIDSYGDSWNGGQLVVSVNGVEQGTYANTAEAGAGVAQTVALSTSYGDVVTFDFTCGSYCGETSFNVTDADGNVVASGGGSDTADATFECLDPDAVNLSASVTTDGALATFSFTVDNFTVGAAPGEGDGHIHWSIFDSSDLATEIAAGMIYSTEDVTLPLPNGNHTMVFSLVDPSHQPLDPAVESTVVFSTFDATVACDSSYTYTYGDNESGILFTSTNPDGGAVTVTMTGQTETCCDEVVITDGAGNELYNAGGDHTGVSVTSEDGTINVSIVSDSSWSPGGNGLGNGTEMTFDITCATAEEAALSLQGIMDFTTPGAWFRGLHVVASADIPDLSVYGLGVATNGGGTDGIEIELTGSAAAGDNILIARSANATADIIDVYLNATDLYDQIIIQNDNSLFASNGDDAIELFFNGEVVETYGDIDVDGSGQSWEYQDSWAWKQADGTWINGDVNCTDGSFLMWDSGCVYPFVVDQQCTGASTDLVTAFSHDFEAVGPAGYWWVNAQAGTFRVDDPITADGSGGNDFNGVMEYTDDGSEAYSNLQMRFCSKLDLNSVNTVSLRAMIISGETLTGTQNNQLALKLQDATDDQPWANQNTVVQDITVTDQWVDLEFTFNDAASMARTDVDNIVIQFNGENNNDAVVAYIDDIVFSYTEPTTSTTAVTFNVDMSQYELADGDTVHVNGEFTGWCGDCGYNVMSDEDGDGVYTLTLDLEPGSYFWKYTVNGWAAQEGFSEAIDGCTANNNGNFDRQVVVGAEAIELSYCWNSCEAAGSCSPVEPILMPIDHEDESVVYAWNDFGGAATSVIANPDASGVNTSATVAQSIKTAGSETWAGTFIVLDEQLDFSTITTLAVDVWTPDGGELVNLKVENAADGNIAIELNQPTTVAAGWETLYYDLSGGDLSQVYDKLVFFFDFNVGGDDTAYYFDNIRLEEASTSITGPWCEAFEGGEVPPAEWTSYIGTNGAGTGSNWEASTISTDGGTGAFVAYENSGDVNEDWLVTPMFTPGEDSDWLTYYEADSYTSDYGSSYSIRVSTSSQTDHDSFVTISEYGEMNIGNINGTNGFQYNEADLSAYIGTPIYVAFVLTNNDGDGWYLDEICVGGAGLSVSDNTLLDMRIYPNPSNGSYVTIQTPVNGVKYVEVFDITGKRLINTSLNADTLDVSSISSGIYLVKVTVEGQSKTSKLIIR